MRVPDKAFVLAAGLGTRLKPLTLGIPKPLLPLWDKPLLFHLLDMLESWGVRDVLINLHHLADRTFAETCRRHGTGLRISFSYEPSVMGTGGAIRRADWFVASQPFWMVNADLAVDLTPEPILKAFSSGRCLSALWVVPDRGPRTVELRQGRVCSFRSHSPGAPGTYTFSGLHLVAPEILHYIPEGPSSIIEAYETAMACGEEVLGVQIPNSYWADLGTPSGYLQAHQDSLRRLNAGKSVRFSGGASAIRIPRKPRERHAPMGGVDTFLSAAGSVRVFGGARIRRVIAMAGSTIASDANLTDAIIAPGCEVHGNLSGVVVRAEEAGSTAVMEAIHLLDWNPERTLAVPLEARGSGRTFTRLACGLRRAMIVEYSSERPENRRYASHARFLASAGLPVPKVLAHSAEKHLLVLEDLGDTSLRSSYDRMSEPECRRKYRTTLEAMVRLHTHATRLLASRRLSLEPAFGPAVFEYERGLFMDFFLRRRCGTTSMRLRSIRSELRDMADTFHGTQVLVHRDFQSDNVMLNRGRPYLIDFQGMRMGPATYDLASLLCDPYVSLPPPLQTELLQYYATRAGISGPDLMERFWHMAVQRLIQALGAYARLSLAPATRRFAFHIPGGLRMLSLALDHVQTFRHTRTIIHELLRKETKS